MPAPRAIPVFCGRTVRHTSGHQIVAILEIVSPANKDRAASVHDFVKKVEAMLHKGVNVMVADLLLPGNHDPRGMHGEIWSSYAIEQHGPPAGQPLTISSYLAEEDVEAYVEHLKFGDPLPEMPLFLDDETYIYVPLESTYEAAVSDLPDFCRNVLDATRVTP